jgi:hypothetical protein
MSRSRFAVRIALAAPVLASFVLAVSPAAQSATTGTGSTARPRVTTGGVGHVHGTSGELLGTVNPRGLETTYFFQYGPTTAYGAQTPPANVGKGILTVKVGQTVAALPSGDHYRIVASNSAGTSPGRDRTYTSKKSKLKFVMASTKEEAPTPYGGTYLLRGTLSGTGGALHPVAAESSPFPFLTAFAAFGVPLTTNSTGAFIVEAKDLTQSTQFRVMTRDARPLLGPIVTAHVAVKVSLKVRSSSHKGLVRLYGTVTPAKVGAQVLFQLEKPARPHGKSEKEVRFATQDSTVSKRGTRTVSRFSKVVTIRSGGRYRAYVVLHTGALVSGASTSLTLHAAPGTTRKKK